jgi:hypothetical protein
MPAYWFVRYSKDGALRRFNLGTYPGVTLKSARTRAETTIGRLARGEDPQAERSEQRSATTFGDLAASYLELHAKQKKRTWEEDLRILNHDLLPKWRRLPAASIGRREIATLLDRIVERGAPVMANRTHALISKLFAWGKKRGHVDSNPAADVQKPGEEGSRDRVLSVPEIQTLWTLWETENSVTSAALQMLLLTGVRLTEALTMRWEDISGDWWTIPPHSSPHYKEQARASDLSLLVDACAACHAPHVSRPSAALLAMGLSQPAEPHPHRLSEQGCRALSSASR